jgi:hypothetical protein
VMEWVMEWWSDRGGTESWRSGRVVAHGDGSDGDNFPAPPRRHNCSKQRKKPKRNDENNAKTARIQRSTLKHNKTSAIKNTIWAQQSAMQRMQRNAAQLSKAQCIEG